MPFRPIFAPVKKARVEHRSPMGYRVWSRDDIARLKHHLQYAHPSFRRSWTQIAKCFKTSAKTIRRWYARLVVAKGDVNEVAMGSHMAPAVTAVKQTQLQQRRRLVESLAAATHSVNEREEPRFPSLEAIRQELALKKIRVSRATIRRDLLSLGRVSRVRPKAPTRKLAEIRRRLNWLRVHRKLDPAEIMWSDETYPGSNQHLACRTMWVRRGCDALSRECARWPVRVGLWGAIAIGYRKLVVLPSKPKKAPAKRGRPRKKPLGRPKKTPVPPKEKYMVNQLVYLNRCVKTIVPHLKKKKLTLMQDGASSHTAKSVKEYLAKEKIKLLTGWPAHSPDLNPIEEVWAILGRAISRHHCTSRVQLVRVIWLEWRRIPQQTIDDTIRRWSKKAQAVWEAKGEFVRTKKVPCGRAV